MTSTLRCGVMGRLWPYRTGGMQNVVYELPRIPLLGTSVNKTFPSHAPEVRSCHHGGGGKHVPPFSSRREENCRGRSGTRRGHPEHPRTGDGSAVGTKEPPGERRSCSGSCAQV